MRPPPPSFVDLRLPDPSRFVFNFNAQSNLDYLVQSRLSLGAGDWLTLQDLSSTPTNRLIRYTNSMTGTKSPFFRLKVGP